MVRYKNGADGSPLYVNMPRQMCQTHTLVGTHTHTHTEPSMILFRSTPRSGKWNCGQKGKEQISQKATVYKKKEKKKKHSFQKEKREALMGVSMGPLSFFARSAAYVWCN